MKIKLLVVGKTTPQALQSLIEDYEKRLKRFLNFEITEIPDIKKGHKYPREQLKRLEWEKIEQKISADDLVILMDEKGKSLTSKGLANKLQGFLNSGVRQVVFVVGGAYGFPEEKKNGSYELLSLSQMTFSHQMVRLFLVEQLYRAFSILKGHPYHNE